MAFKDMLTVEGADFYLDVAFRAATRKADMLKGKKFDDRLTAKKTIEITKIDTVASVLKKHLDAVLKSFPSLDNLPVFYNELIKITLDYDELKQSLGALKWAGNSVDKFHRLYHEKIKKTDDYRKIEEYKGEYYGRISSVIKQVKKNLAALANARKLMVRFPAIKSNCITVAIAGFPNVGKTTLLSKLTGSKPEISSYAFTTKTLNLGYSTIKHQRVQFIDTPGTLNRLEKMNVIERQAHLAIRHVADAVIYVFDITEPYPIDEQIKLLKKIKAEKKPVFLYLSKQDILPAEKIKEFASRHPIMSIDDINGKIEAIIVSAAKI